ncbi:MAG: EamA/RhaT family transporter [Sphingobacteriaceae bacterium]
MIFNFLSIFCSVCVSVLLKVAKRYEVNINQAIAFNYAIAALLCAYFFTPDFSRVKEAPMGIYLLLGLLLPAIFVIMARSVKHTGIVITDIAQRLSLLIPLLAAFLLFKEEFSFIKLGIIALGLFAVICAIPWQKNEQKGSNSWLFPLGVFLGFGLIDVLFKQIAVFKAVPFTTSLLLVFLFALGLSMLVLFYFLVFKGMRLSVKNTGFGLVLGVFNFGNIIFYLKAHQALNNHPSMVFTSMNIGVIAVGSLVGLLVFKEKLSKLNYLGIALALVAILLIYLL